MNGELFIFQISSNITHDPVAGQLCISTMLESRIKEMSNLGRLTDQITEAILNDKENVLSCLGEKKCWYVPMHYKNKVHGIR